VPIADIKPHDVHVHVVYTQDGSVAGTNAGELLAAMDTAGVEKAAVITPQPLGWDNSATFVATSAFPDRFVAIVRLDVRADDAAEVTASLHDQGARGIRIHLFDETDVSWLVDGSIDKTVGALIERNSNLAFHCRPDQLPAVGDFAARNPALTVLVDHIGRPNVRAGADGPEFQGFLELAKYPNVFGKSPDPNFFSEAPPPHLDLVPFLELALDRFGADRILWGSDWPLSAQQEEYAASLEPLTTVLADASVAEQHAVLRGNFERLFCS
jgi:L-fuconolactonase